jgi:hypothetical protein
MAGKSAVSATVWRKIRHEYQTTKTSCKALALKYGIVPGTVSNRCKLEKWRSSHPRAETKPSATKPPFPSSDDAQAPQGARARVLRDALTWLDRLEDAYQNDRQYDRVEAAQKLIPLWNKVAETVSKLTAPVEGGTQRPLVSMNILCGEASLPPLSSVIEADPVD